MTANAPDGTPSGPLRSGSNRKRQRTLVCALIVLALGAGLRSMQYFGRVDFWFDELAVVRNVEDRGLGALLTRPLDHFQVAPVGNLALLDVTATLAGVSEAGLRLGPWLLSLAALLLFWRVAQRFASGYSLLAALAVFAVCPAMTWYGISVKPYGGDVTMSLLLVWLSLRFLERPDDMRRGVTAGILGGAALLMSFPAVPTATILGVWLALLWWRRHPRPPAKPLASLAAGWILGATIAAWAALSLLDPGTDEFMRQFWADDFPPIQPVAALGWISGRFYGTFAHSLVLLPPDNPVLAFIVGVPLILAAVGVAFVAWQRNAAAVLLLVPPVAGLAAAFLQLLPFRERLGLHACWPVLVLAAFALTRLAQVLPGRWRIAGHTFATLMALPITVIVLLAARPPYTSEGVKPRSVLEDVAERLQEGDRIYVYIQGQHDMAFYGTRAGIEEWTQGERHHDDPRGYLREADALRGEPRAWFFWVRLDGNEPALIRRYLETIGRELERIPDRDAPPAGAVLYDLSDAEELEQASAESFPLSGSEQGESVDDSCSSTALFPSSAICDK